MQAGSRPNFFSYLWQEVAVAGTVVKKQALFSPEKPIFLSPDTSPKIPLLILQDSLLCLPSWALICGPPDVRPSQNKLFHHYNLFFLTEADSFNLVKYSHVLNATNGNLYWFKETWKNISRNGKRQKNFCREKMAVSDRSCQSRWADIDELFTFTSGSSV